MIYDFTSITFTRITYKNIIYPIRGNQITFTAPNLAFECIKKRPEVLFNQYIPSFTHNLKYTRSNYYINSISFITIRHL